MTRRSPREIERALESLDADPDGTDDGGGFAVVWENPATGEYYKDGDLSEIPEETDPVMVFVQRGEAENPPAEEDADP